jgi:hypothetical protein
MIQLQRLLFTTLVSISCLLSAEEPLQPWFTKPILAGSGTIIPAGHYQIQPYLLCYKRFASFNNHWNPQTIVTLWSVEEHLPIWIGLTSWADLKIDPIASWNYRDHQTEWTVGDWYAQLDIQLHRDTLNSGSPWPSIKLIIRETFPTGNYKNLNPLKLGTDGGGMGCWRTTLGFCSSKIFQIRDIHFLKLYFNATVSFAPSLHVSGFNA